MGRRPGAGLFVELSPAGQRGRLSASGLYYVVRALGERLEMAVGPHGLRHALMITVALRVAVLSVP